MGSDLAMERIVDTTRHGVWEMEGDEQVFRIYSVSGYDGKKKVIWEGSGDDLDSETVYKLVSLLIPNVPARPEPVKTLRTRVYSILHREFWGTVVEYGWDVETLWDIADNIIEEVKREV